MDVIDDSAVIVIPSDDEDEDVVLIREEKAPVKKAESFKPSRRVHSSQQQSSITSQIGLFNSSSQLTPSAEVPLYNSKLTPSAELPLSTIDDLLVRGRDSISVADDYFVCRSANDGSDRSTNIMDVDTDFCVSITNSAQMNQFLSIPSANDVTRTFFQDTSLTGQIEECDGDLFIESVTETSIPALSDPASKSDQFPLLCHLKNPPVSTSKDNAQNIMATSVYPHATMQSFHQLTSGDKFPTSDLRTQSNLVHDKSLDHSLPNCPIKTFVSQAQTTDPVITASLAFIDSINFKDKNDNTLLTFCQKDTMQIHPPSREMPQSEKKMEPDAVININTDWNMTSIDQIQPSLWNISSAEWKSYQSDYQLTESNVLSQDTSISLNELKKSDCCFQKMEPQYKNVDCNSNYITDATPLSSTLLASDTNNTQNQFINSLLNERNNTNETSRTNGVSDGSSTTSCFKFNDVRKKTCTNKIPKDNEMESTKLWLLERFLSDSNPDSKSTVKSLHITNKWPSSFNYSERKTDIDETLKKHMRLSEDLKQKKSDFQYQFSENVKCKPWKDSLSELLNSPRGNTCDTTIELKVSSILKRDSSSLSCETYSVDLKKSSLTSHQANLVCDLSANDSESTLNNQHIQSECGKLKNMETNDSLIHCESCGTPSSRQQLSVCSRTHGSCSRCLEAQVKVVLIKGNKQKNIRCSTFGCNDSLSFAELKKTLPSFVVEILEENLHQEYKEYISKWIFSEEGFKSKHEFAKLDLDMMKNSGRINNLTLNRKPTLAFNVVPDTEEYRALALQFHETLTFGDYDIVRIIRLQNPILWKYYTIKRKEMVQENDNKDVLEMKLFHGTSHSTVEGIARKGFDWRLCGKHGTLYGDGSYFATSAKYSHSYTDCGGSDTSKWNFSPFAKYARHKRYRSRKGQSHRSNASLQPTPFTASLPNQQVSSSTHIHSGLASSGNLQPLSGSFTSTCQSSPQGASSSGTDLLSALLSQTFSTLTQNEPLNLSVFQNDSSCGSPAVETSDKETMLPEPVNHDHASISQPDRVEGTSDLTSTFTRDPTSKSRFMFVARVLVGRSTVGRSGLKRPPPLDELKPFKKSFDSCVDQITSPKMYVIFDSNQAYPEYVIEYTSHVD